MKTKFLLKAQFLLVYGLLILLSGCGQMSEEVKDKSAGLNGSFEVSSNGLPVNWPMYTPKTVPDAEFDIILDKEIYKEGIQSLKFDVKKCSSMGGRYSPGFTNEFFEVGKYEGDNNYKMTFWIKNNGAKFSISAGAVSGIEGDMKILLESSDQIDNWRLLEYEIDIPKNRWLRMQLNILQPGTFWIDDIRIKNYKTAHDKSHNR